MDGSQNLVENPTAGIKYFPAPHSLDPIPDDIWTGLIPLSLFGLLSFVSTLILLGWIFYRMASWRSHYRTFVGYNQYVVLVVNLLLADLQQSGAFLVSFHWLRRRYILAPTPACFAQGWLLHSGDVASGLFVLLIALHTYFTAVVGYRFETRTFFAVVSGTWVFAYFLTALGPMLYGDSYFVRAGSWCWVSNEYETERLALHYIWVFLLQFGTIIIYLLTFYQLRRKTSRLFEQAGQSGGAAANARTIQAVNRITQPMVLYPLVYIVLTLPLSAGRMYAMAHNGKHISVIHDAVAGSLLTSCGWVDTLLYTLTRRRLLKDTTPGHGSGSGARRSRWENQLGSQGITHTRTVTIANHGVHELDEADAEFRKRERGVGAVGVGERAHSPTGSLDPILMRLGQKGQSKAEVTVGSRDVFDEGDDSSGSGK